MADFRVTFSIRDADNGETVKSFTGTYVDFATALVAADALRVDLQAAMGAQIYKQELAQVDLVAGAPAVGSNVFKRASATVTLDGSTDKANFTLPSPVAAINPSGSTFNPAATEWTDLMANFATGGWQVSDGENIDGTVGGKVAYYGSGSTNF